MAKYIDAEKLITKIKELNLVTKTYDEQVAFNNALAMVVEIITSIQEEQSEVDLEELEKEIKRYLQEIYDRDTTVRDVARHFAKWQKEQMMKEAVEGEYDFYPAAVYLDVPIPRMNHGDKVRVIVCKKED